MRTAENYSFLSHSDDDPGFGDADWNVGERKEIARQNELDEGNGPSGVSQAVAFNAFAPSGSWLSGQVGARGDSLSGGVRACDFVFSAIGR